jgi:hypothetical protein
MEMSMTSQSGFDNTVEGKRRFYRSAGPMEQTSSYLNMVENLVPRPLWTIIT